MLKINKKGFTLVELLAVIIIIGVIGLIVFPSAIESINNSKEKLYREQVDRILDATDSWSSSHDSLLPDNTSNSTPIYITVDVLQKAGLLKKEDVKNPVDSSETMDDKIVIYYDANYNQYVTGYCDVTNYALYYSETEWTEINTNCNKAEAVS